MALTNDPKIEMSENMMKNISELVEKKKSLAEIKKDLKENPDVRYGKRKDLGLEVKELTEMICDELEDDQEIMVGKRKFKKQRKNVPKYTKVLVQDFFVQKSINPETYEEENTEEKISLAAVNKA